ncbi:MAG: alpha/beta fold hydrolase [Pirellulaceae bacterium]
MFAWLNDRLVLRPNRHPIQAPGKMRRMIDMPGGRFEVYVQRAGRLERSPELFVLKFSGTAGRAERAGVHPADVWDDLAVEVWAVNPPGYGGSPGRASLRHAAGMAEAIYTAIRQEAGDRPIVVTGNSLGTTTALLTAARYDVAGLILRNPLPMRELILGRFGWWNLHLAAPVFARHLPTELCSIRNALRSTAPAVFISSSRDRIIPPKYQQLVFEAHAGPRRIMRLPEADHADPMSEEEAREYVKMLGWLREHIPLGEVERSTPNLQGG